MCGLVASGAVFLLTTTAHWLVTQFASAFNRKYTAPAWWQSWLSCAIPLSVGIVFITTRFNYPTLPLSIALLCVISTLAGLAIALYTSSLVVTAPRECFKLAIVALGLVPIFLLLRAIELPSAGLSTFSFAYSLAIGGTIAGLLWSITVVWLQSRLYPFTCTRVALNVYVTGLCISYLLLPLIHYIVFTPPQYRYISLSANFFALNSSIQLITMIVGVFMAIALAKLQERWSIQNPKGKNE